MNSKVINPESHPAAQFFSYSIPAIVAMLLTSGIVIIDGLFIGNIIGKMGLAAVNLTLPVLYLFLGVAIMIGVGGAVKTSHALGAEQEHHAGRHFSVTIGLAVIVILALTFFCILFFDRLLAQLNTDGMLDHLVEAYLGTMLWFYPAVMLNIVFSIFIRTQGRPGLSLFFGVAGNALNLVLDYLMIVRWGMGLRGAALASGISAVVPMSCGFAYFLSGRSVLRFVKFSWDWPEIWQILYNGSSEMVGQFAVGLTTWVFNLVILSRMGVEGVAAYTIVGYTALFQIMIVTGFATGIGPIVGFSHGAGESEHIRRVMRIALVSGFIAGLFCWAMVLLFSAHLAGAFSRGPGILTIARSGYALFTAAFLLNGFNILITAYFTSIGDARTSMIIAVMRGVVLINGLVLILPLFMGSVGIWASYPLAEMATLVFAAMFLKRSYRSSSGRGCSRNVSAVKPTCSGAS